MDPSPLLPEISYKQAKTLPQLDQASVQFVFISDFYDGPVSGMLRHNGELFWFEAVWPEDGRDRSLGAGVERVLLVFRLTEEQWREEECWRQLAREKVGTHGDLEVPGPPESRPEELQREFVDAYQTRRPLDVRGNEIIGWVRG